jgi:hypothetical protein
MHHLAFVLVPPTSVKSPSLAEALDMGPNAVRMVIEDAVKELMAPFSEERPMRPYVRYHKAQAPQYLADALRTVRRKLSESPDHSYYQQKLATLEQMTPEQYWAELTKYEDEFDPEGNVLSTSNPEGIWDWYQVGGRWTGFLDGYDPEQDPKNIQKCEICGGTGKRTDEVGQMAREQNPDYTCNGCQGKGSRAKWPTSWADHAGDVEPMTSVLGRLASYEYLPGTIIAMEEGEPVLLQGERWNGQDFVDTLDFEQRRLDLFQRHADDLCVVVDYHS